MKNFMLYRHEDATGISGKGVVAEGVQFNDGSCVLRWTTAVRSTVFYDTIEAVEKIHGHGGKTEVVWTSYVFDNAVLDCALDGCENAPFASIGGLDKRGDMKAPKWNAANAESEYLRGYRHAARRQYGEDWETCSFGWSPAITIGGDK